MNEYIDPYQQNDSDFTPDACPVPENGINGVGIASISQIDATHFKITLTNNQEYVLTLPVGIGEKGDDGDSAYQVWLNAGNTGTVNDFLESLIGEDGTDGKSAYQIWLENGHSGTESQFLASLIGATGASAYQVWLNAGNVGSVSVYLNSLKGSDGSNGINVRSGAGVPGDVIGNNGDAFIDYTTGNYYTKNSGVYSLQGNVKGPKGDEGDKGLNWAGNFPDTSPYNIDDAIQFEGSSYICLVDGTTLSPTASPSSWNLIAAKASDVTNFITSDTTQEELTGDKQSYGNWRFNSTYSQEAYAGDEPDVMGPMGVTMPGDENVYAFFGLSRTENFALAIGMDTTNNLVIGTGVGRGKGATITPVMSFNPSTGAIICFSLTQTSLRKFKENIESYNEDALEFINKLKIRSFNFKNSLNDNQLGFIIDEIEDVNPIILNKEKTGINVNNLIAQLTKAVQELSSKVTELESKLKTN